MAWRIDEAVIRGEIDNRVYGWVTGRIWFVGRAAPVQLKLSGNCWRDLAGRFLEFSNPKPRSADLTGFVEEQTGVVGDITAARRVKVPEIPMDQVIDHCLANKPWPWHWGNALYLEWFGERNGRAVIETAGFVLTIAGEPAWESTPENESEQRNANAGALTAFMDRLVAAREPRLKAGGKINATGDETDGL